MMMTDARGKLGGHVFTKTRSGATVRTKVTPHNPQSASQGSARSILSQLSRGWSNLTEPQRASWNGAVESFQLTNVFGDSYLPSGKNLYTSLNANLANIGLPLITSAPASSPVDSAEVSSVVITLPAGILTGDILINANPAEVPPGLTAVLECTPQANAGRYNFSGKFVKLYIVTDGDDFSTFSSVIFTSYVEKFGTPVVGKKIAFRVKYVNNASGQVSPYQTVTTIVA